MDAQRFDRLVRTLNGAGSRRRLLREALAGLFGGVVVTLGSGLLDASDTEAKRNKRSRKRKKQRSRKARVESERAAQAKAGKVRICHFTGDPNNPYNVLEVSGNALNAHVTNHGDFVINDEDGCCLDSDCTEFPNSFCDEDADGGAQCACEPTDRDVACENQPCGVPVSDGCGENYECECGCAEVGDPCHNPDSVAKVRMSHASV